MKTVYGSPFSIDWEDVEAVKAYARKFGKGMTVYKHPDRKNYNITFTSRWVDLHSHEEGLEIVLQT